nr:hypothetical protein [Tanacetum cinerariifolium]
MVRHDQIGDTVLYDGLCDSLVQFEPHVLASKAKKAAKNHDLLSLLDHLNASSSQSHANSSYLPQPYYVIHPSSVLDYEDEYQGNAGRQNKNEAFNAGNGNDDTNWIKPRVRDAKYFREQMLLAIKDEAGSILKYEENDFLLDNSYGEQKIKELTATVMLMARIQPADGNNKTVPSYDAKAVSEVNASFKVHEQVSHVKRKTIIQTCDDDPIDFNIKFYDPYVENNGGTSDHVLNAHDDYHEI